MTVVDYRNGVAIGELVFYVPALAIAVFLLIRHGLSGLAAWYFMCMFTLVRVLGACFQLATITQPDNHSLYIGAYVLIGIAISPLQLTALALLSRVVTNINKLTPTVVGPRHIRIAELICTLGLILSIVGKSLSPPDQRISEAGLMLFAVTFIAIVGITLIAWASISHVEPGEKRILLAVGLSLPCILVRLIYSIISTFDTSSTSFNSVTGSVNILLFMALIEEIIVVVLYEGVGVTLKKIVKAQRPQPAYGSEVGVPLVSTTHPRRHSGGMVSN